MGKDLLKKYLQGTCTEEEFEQLLIWLKNESYTVSGREMVREIWNEFEPEAGTPERAKYSRILDRIHHQINITQNTNRSINPERRSKKRILSVLTRIAAVLLLPALLLLAYTYLARNSKFATNIADLEVGTPAGGRMHLVLGDGTKVWLNGESKLSYPYQFQGSERRVTLSGEAYFEVAHNQKIPFIVKTDHLSVKATGTAFNVNAYPGEKVVETTLVEGKVILYAENNQEIRALSPNEHLKFNFKKDIYSVETGNMNKYVVWKEGLLVFKNDPIVEVIKRIEHWYNVDVEITDDRVKELTYTGTFDNESLTQVLELMALATPVNYKIIRRDKLPDGSFSRQKVLIGLNDNYLIDLKNEMPMK